MSNAIDILVEHFTSLNFIRVENKRAESFTVGWKESHFLSANVRELQTKRQIENPERFLYSKANMEPNAIDCEDKHHTKMEVAYSLVMRDPRIPKNCKKDL